jgi:sugar-specific transcriptional regulator TrmB
MSALTNLVDFGLTEKEAKVYLAMLELEVATAHDVAKVTDVNRSSAYVVLESLQKQGLVSVSGGSKIKKYIASSPEHLARLADLKTSQKIRAKKGIDDIIPELKLLYKESKKKPNIRLYEGKQGIMNLVEETLKAKEKILRVYTSGSEMHEFFRDYMPTYMEKRAKAGLRMRGIHPDNETNRALAKYMPETDSSVFISPDKYKFTSDFSVHDDIVAYISHKGEHGIAIQDIEIADAVKSAFDLAYDGAKNLIKSSEK